MNQSAKSLRIHIRQARRHLSRIQQHQHSRIISRSIIHSRFYRYSRHIALYLSADGEVDLSPLINKIHGHYKKCYLPVILSRENGIMAFAPYNKNTRLRKNSFGILEPVYPKKHLKSARQLDLVLAPLVAFDPQGHRVGMGGGYYDRALNHLRRQGQNSQSIRKHHPLFVGIAHEIQQVDALQAQPWDIPLHAIVTEKGLRYFY